MTSLTGTFRGRCDGAVVFVAPRPGPEWHAHGTTPRRLTTIVGAELRRIVLLKPRWRHRETGETCHSRPPDDVAAVRACTLVVVLKLWSWNSSAEGVHRRREVLPALDEIAVPRTVQRWMRRPTPAIPTARSNPPDPDHSGTRSTRLSHLRSRET